MKQYLNINHIDGSEIEPVDVITFGSPCQGLSVAGLRKGLADERSNLFYEAVRVIEEMREKTNGTYPRYAVWENVKGAFSSDNGRDFQCVLHTLTQLADKEAPVVPIPKEKWPHAGNLMGDGWSLSWRVFDAQHWGVPQRRNRILLVMDFAGESAPEILFKQESLSRDFATLPDTWQRTSITSTECTGATNHGESGLNSISFSDVASTLRAGAGAPKHTSDMVGRLVGQREEVTSLHLTQTPVHFVEKTPCLSCGSKTGQAVVGVCVPDEETYCLQGSMIGREEKNGPRGSGINEDVSFTLNTIDRHAVCCEETDSQQLYENHRADCRYRGPLETAPTLCSRYGTGGDNVPYVLSVDTSHAGEVFRTDTVSPALQARDYKGGENVMVEEEAVYDLNRESFNAGMNYGGYPNISDGGVCSTLMSTGPSAVGVSERTGDEKRYRIRRLTPTECARLQGFPDWWAKLPYIDDMSDKDYDFWKEVLKEWATIDGKTYKEKTKKQMISWYNKLHTDSSEYKMWGNGVALPMVRYVMRGVTQNGAKTMGSLFDGSGGFPLAGVLEGITSVWSSEVQPYPIAVTKARWNILR